MLKLIGTDGTRLYSFDLEPGKHILGRSSERALYIPDKTVSRFHAEIEVTPSDECYVIDTGSYNGTTVNGTRINSRVKVEIGDKIMFGRTEFRLRGDNSVEASATRPTATLLAESDPEKSVLLSINEALKPLPSKVTELPELFPTLSEMARMLILPEPREVMLERSLALVNKIIPAERLAVLLTEDDDDRICTAAVLLPGGKDPGGFTLSKTIVNDILTNKNAILIGDPKDDTRFAAQQSIVMSGLRSAMAAPLFDEDDVLGILYVDTTNPMHHYNDDYLRLLATFANIIGSRMMNYELLRERQEKEVYEAELKRASTIQQTLLRRDNPQIEGYAIHAFQEQCRAVGGDLYDIANLPDGRLVFMVGDVSGKGMGAALLMSNILASFRILYNVTEFSLSEVVSLVSRQLFSSSMAMDFATMFIGVLDQRSHTLAYLNAGHNPPLLIRHSGKQEYLQASGTMIGAFDFGNWAEDTITMEPNDTLVVFTDGVTEAEKGELQYGDRRLESLVADSIGLQPCELCECIMQDVLKFAEDTPRSDDITMLILKRNA